MIENVREFLLAMENEQGDRYDDELFHICNFILGGEISIQDLAAAVVSFYEEGSLKRVSSKVLDIYYHLPYDISLAFADLIPEEIRQEAHFWQ